MTWQELSDKIQIMAETLPEEEAKAVFISEKERIPYAIESIKVVDFGGAIVINDTAPSM